MRSATMKPTNIEYLTHTWNPTVGCDGLNCSVRVVCWARAQARRQFHRCLSCYNFTPHFHPERLEQPLHEHKPAIVGTCFSSDFYGARIKLEWQMQVMAVIEKATWHRFVLPTKQPQNILTDTTFPPNLWTGVSVNRQSDISRLESLAARPNIPHTFLSAEPLLEDLGEIALLLKRARIEWVIIGAQTRPTVQPKTDWVHNLTLQARELDLAVFFKRNLQVHIKTGPFPFRELPSGLQIRSAQK